MSLLNEEVKAYTKTEVAMEIISISCKWFGIGLAVAIGLVTPCLLIISLIFSSTDLHEMGKIKSMNITFVNGTTKIMTTPSKTTHAISISASVLGLVVSLAAVGFLTNHVYGLYFPDN